MKNIKTYAVMGLAALLMGGVATTAGATESTDTAAATGSAAVTQGKTYTLAEMLTYAMQDEYAAKAEYAKIMATYGTQKPFSNIAKAEDKHIAALTPLFAKYNVAMPSATGAAVVLPGSLAETYQIGVDAEIKNIAMYDAFLKQDLPADVKAVFTELRDASKNHQAAFERQVTKSAGQASGAQAAKGQGQGQGKGAGQGQGKGAGQQSGAKGNQNQNKTGGQDCDGSGQQSGNRQR